MKLTCGHCGVESGEHDKTVEDTFTWRCALCMTKFEHIGRKRILKTKKEFVKSHYGIGEKDGE